MISRKLAARALTLLPAIVLVVCGFLQLRAQAMRVRAAVAQRAVMLGTSGEGATFVVAQPPAHRRGRASKHGA